ncbi:uncharacterized protein LOC110603701 isoform X3 [Manihot esculenta]|uniref:uncharacterized protein LOC110603701 isoform X3 n=1 Tax=Manihot esculenta TaxID=3983 RepID=UPI000B5D6A77|nr:uncharacterized protein LOC110603701 isoform X3 [Manihot esculenta]
MSWLSLARARRIPHIKSVLKCHPLQPRAHDFSGANRYKNISTPQNWSSFVGHHRVPVPRFEVSTPPIGRWLDNSCRKRHFATYQTFTSAERKSRKMLIYLTGVVAVMIGCTYAAVPLYRRFCQATGYGGTIQRRETVEEKIARHGISWCNLMPMWLMECLGSLSLLKERFPFAYNLFSKKLPCTSIKYNAFALRSSVFFLGSKLICLYSFILTQNSKQIQEWMELTI